MRSLLRIAESFGARHVPAIGARSDGRSSQGLDRLRPPADRSARRIAVHKGPGGRAETSVFRPMGRRSDRDARPSIRHNRPDVPRRLSAAVAQSRRSEFGRPAAARRRSSQRPPDRDRDYPPGPRSAPVAPAACRSRSSLLLPTQPSQRRLVPIEVFVLQPFDRAEPPFLGDGDLHLGVADNDPRQGQPGQFVPGLRRDPRGRPNPTEPRSTPRAFGGPPAAAALARRSAGCRHPSARRNARPGPGRSPRPGRRWRRRSRSFSHPSGPL